MSGHPSELINFRRKPKAERKSPVYVFQHDYSSYEEAMLEVGLSNLSYFDVARTPVPTRVIQKIIREKIAIHEGEKSVTLTASRHVVRFNREAKKPYSTWETLAVRTIFLTSRGNVHFYFYNIDITSTGQRKRQVMSVFDSNYALDGMGLSAGFPRHDAFPAMGRPPMTMLRAYAEQKFGKSVALEKVYPMREILGPQGNILLPSGAMRSSNASDFTRELFGKKCYRKDLVRAVGFVICHKAQYGMNYRSYNAQKLYWVSLFKGRVPTDWIVTALNDPYIAPPSRGEASDIKELSTSQRQTFWALLDRLKPAERRNLLMNTGSWYEFTDTLRPFLHGNCDIEELIPARRDNFKGVRDLHDRVFAAEREIIRRNRIKADAERYKPENMWVNKDDKGKTMADRLEFPVPLNVPFRIKIARDYDTVAEWGDYMNNCIGGYFSQPDTILGGVYEGKELMANFEIKNVTRHEMRDVAYYVDDGPVAYYAAEDVIAPSTALANKTVMRRERVAVHEFELRQLLGKYNASLDKDYRAKVEEFLGALGVKMATGRWV